MYHENVKTTLIQHTQRLTITKTTMKQLMINIVTNKIKSHYVRGIEYTQEQLDMLTTMNVWELIQIRYHLSK